jgi:hypothetical protein
MAKLKVIEAQEQSDKETRVAEEAARMDRKKNKGQKARGNRKAVNDNPVDVEVIIGSEPRVSSAPPVLPDILKATGRGPPPVNDDETDSESEDSVPPRRNTRRGSTETAADRWVAGSSDEEEGKPRRTTGVGPRYRNHDHAISGPLNDDSEEDMPLAATVGRALQRAMSSGANDSDEDLPLSAMLDKAKLNIPPINFGSLPLTNPKNDDDDDDDDDQPLGLRASMVPPSSRSYAGDDDDDKPLAFHPDQQRRTQYQAMAQQQHMMMQAQMQQSMFFGAPSIMGSGFFGPSMSAMPSPMIMGPVLQQPLPSPVPTPDAGKFGLVDRWRHDVAVEGQP